MKGQFGLDLQGGPGGIYKVDGRTGAVTLFANVTLDGVPNPGPGLGNLAYDSDHKQIFVSDLYTGMIHRFDLDGKELGHYDHGVTGLACGQPRSRCVRSREPSQHRQRAFRHRAAGHLGICSDRAPGLGPRRT